MKRRICCFIYIILILATLASCANASAGFSDGPPLLIPIATQMDTFVVERGPVKHIDLVEGMLRVNSVPLYFNLAQARMGDIYVKPGDEVTAGQILARINTDIETMQAARQAEIVDRMRQTQLLTQQQNQLELDILIASYNNRPSVSLRESISWATLLNQQAVEIDAIALAAEELRLTELMNNLENAYLVAPFDGIITDILASEGAVVRRHQHIIYVAEKGQTVFVELIDHSTNLNITRLIRQAERFEAIIGDKTFEIEPLELTVAELAFYTQRSLSAVGGVQLPVRFNILAEPEELPLLGERVTIKIYFVWYEDVLRIPYSSFFYTQQINTAGGPPIPDGFVIVDLRGGSLILGNIVDYTTAAEPYVMRLEDGILVNVPVTAHVTHTYIAILEGLEEGDVVFVRP